MSVPLAIVGYGKMGHMVEQLASEYGFEVRGRLKAAEMASVTPASLNGAAVAIEFSHPSSAAQNLLQLASLGVNTVCGTTGWYDELPQIRAAVTGANTGLVYGANFSVGVNLFLAIVAQAAAVFAKHPEYQAWGWEIHHAAKKDAPSGTLKKLAEEMRTAGYGGAVNLSSSRAGAHIGTHEIGFDSADDTITLRHTARSREGFARGALLAASWIAEKKGVYEFREIIGALNGKQ